MLDHGLGVNLEVHSVTASKYISELTSLRPLSLQNRGFQVHRQNHDLRVHLKVHRIMASNCVSKRAKYWLPSLHDYRPPCASPNSVNYSLQVCTSMASKCISKLPQAQPPSGSLSSLDDYLQAHLESLSNTTCIQPSYTVCR